MKGGCIIITLPSSITAPGGGTVHCLHIAQHLQSLGVKVILTPTGRLHPSGLEAQGLDIVAARPSRVHYLFDGLSIRKAVKDIMDRRVVEAVLGWSHETAFLPGLLRARGVSFGMIAATSYRVWLTRPTPLTPVKRLVDQWFRCRPLKSADIVYAASNFTRHELIELVKVNPNRIVFAPQGVGNEFTGIRRALQGEIGRFIFFGSLAPLKGIFDAIEALGLVRSKGFQNWTLRVAGWGSQDRVQTAVSRWGIGDLVVPLGRLEHAALPPQLEWAQVAILPSHSESFGLAIAEAQGAGLPVIAYATGAVPEVVEPEVTGWLVTPRRPDLLAGAILQAIENPEQTYLMGLAGRGRVKRLFSWENSARTILDTIQRARGKSLPAPIDRTDSL